MFGYHPREGRGWRRPAAAAVLTAVTVVVLCGFAALTIDVGVLYNTRADLQRAADAAALAAAESLATLDADDPVSRAQQAAARQVKRNPVLGRTVELDLGQDVTVGKAEYDPGSQAYRFTPTLVTADAVRVCVRQTADSPNGSAPLFFANIFGKSSADVSAEAIAYLAPRDIAIVVDVSGSLNDDSELKHYQLTEINLYDVWDALPGGADEIGGTWDLDNLPPDWIAADGSAPQAAGPAWGYMRTLGFGAELDPDSYNPTADPGLIHLRYGRTWNDADLIVYLEDQGYNDYEISAILSPTYDRNNAYDERVAVALGLAYWNSGYPDGLWQRRGVPVSDTGNGNAYIGGSELDWVEAIFDLTHSESADLWRSYISNVANSRSNAAKANSAFRYAFGVKTLVSYLLEQRGSHQDTPELADTPAQPTQAVKDAVAYMVGLVEGLQTRDQMSLVVYATTAHREVPLTDDFGKISKRLNEMQAGHYDSLTNMGGGLQAAINELVSEDARLMSRKIIVLLTDGIANVDEDGRYDGSGAGGSDYALALARQAAEMGIRVYTVSVGAAADQDVMERIARLGHGVHFHAEGTIEEYSAGLADIFTRIGVSRSPELIR